MKAYIELGGDVHTLRVSVGAVTSAAELRATLGRACAASGAPELTAVDMTSAEIQYLNGSDGAPEMLTSATAAETIRTAKAFRVLFSTT